MLFTTPLAWQPGRTKPFGPSRFLPSLPRYAGAVVVLLLLILVQCSPARPYPMPSDSDDTGKPAAADKPATAVLWVHDSLGKNQASDGPRAPSHVQFETFQVKFTATETRKVRIHLHRYDGSGAIIWSDVRVSSSNGKPVPTIKNADFNGGELTPWMYYGHVTWKLLRNGNAAATTSLEEPAGSGGLSQDIEGLVPGATYEISALARWARTENVAIKYDHLLVRRPGKSPEDGKVYVVSNGEKRWVLHGEWIQAHGYKWPNDVHNIPASELDAIPTGPVLEDLK